MKIDLEILAKHLVDRRLTSFDIDSPILEQAVYEWLGNEKLFDKLYETMVDLEQQRRRHATFNGEY